MVPSASFGVNYSDRTKDKISPEAALGTIGGGWYQVDDQYLLKPRTSITRTRERRWRSTSTAYWAQYFNPIVYGDPTDRLPYLAGKYWDVKEKVWTGYLRGDLNHEISDTVTMRGNVGLQIISTDQSSGSFLAANANTAARKSCRSRWHDVHGVPAADQHRASCLTTQAFRFSVAKEMARPAWTS